MVIINKNPSDMLRLDLELTPEALGTKIFASEIHS